MHYIHIVFALLILYLAMSGNLQLSNIVVGLILAIAVVALMRPSKRQINLWNLPLMVLGLVHYTLVLTKEIFLNGLQVARVVLTPSLPIRPGIMAIPSACQTHFCMALSALVITASPGEMVVEMSDDGALYTHFLTMPENEEKIIVAQERRRDLLERIFT